MILSEEIKQKIIDIIDVKLKDSVYKGLPEDKRKALGQVYTPGTICIQMIEKFKTVDSLSGQVILDPCCGSGNLLIACLVAGADINNLYGNDYDADAVALCKERISEAYKELNGHYPTDQEFKPWQIHQGNALHEFALTYFDEDYDEMYFDGLKQTAARNKKLNNEHYNAYTGSEHFKRKHPDLYSEYTNKDFVRTADRQVEQSNTYNLW